MKRVVVAQLPGDPVAASAAFHRETLSAAEQAISEGDVMVVFRPADHTHRAWRRAAIQGLARKAVPYRINAVAGEGAVVEAFAAYLERAAGITGQYFEGDGKGAGNPAE